MALSTVALLHSRCRHYAQRNCGAVAVAVASANASYSTAALAHAVTSHRHPLQHPCHPHPSRTLQQQQQQQQQQQLQQQTGFVVVGRRFKTHLINVIWSESVKGPKGGKAGTVGQARAGYARNFLFPRRLAFYASPEKLRAFQIDWLPPKEHKQVKGRSQAQVLRDQQQRAAIELKQYFQNKRLVIGRHCNPSDPTTLFPNMVDAVAVQKSLSNQLRIDLDEWEAIHLSPEPISPNQADWTPDYLNEICSKLSIRDLCTVEIRKVGFYCARISLAGELFVPLVVQVVRR